MNQVTGLKYNHLIITRRVGKIYKKDIRVYTDRQDANQIITNVPGVVNVFSEQIQKSEHHVYLDPRYDIEIVIQNIQDALEPKSIIDLINEWRDMNPLFR